MVRKCSAPSARAVSVVPSRRFSLPCPSPLAAYDVLKKSDGRTYFFMRDNDFTWFGASPSSLSTMPAMSD